MFGIVDSGENEPSKISWIQLKKRLFWRLTEETDLDLYGYNPSKLLSHPVFQEEFYEISLGNKNSTFSDFCPIRNITIKSIITDLLLSLRVKHIVHSSKVMDIFKFATEKVSKPFLYVWRVSLKRNMQVVTYELLCRASVEISTKFTVFSVLAF